MKISWIAIRRGSNPPDLARSLPNFMQSPGLQNFAKFSRIFKIPQRFLATNG